MAQQIKFSGAMKKAAKTSASVKPLIKHQTTEPHIGRKQLEKLARRAQA